ncbi:phosphoribosyltransferase [Streptomyces sp. SS162]|uniref:phosphoribosyltransferase n=1 Tax=Streptomyces sp. SS162 TaxID=3108484 RepID=UPI002F4159A2
MTTVPVRPLTVGALARDLVASAGQAVSALRCYETLAALWVRAEDRRLPTAERLRASSLRAAGRLIRGEIQVAAPDADLVPRELTSDESIVRLPASLAVQGVEWPDIVQLSERWLSARSDGWPVAVVGVRTGGAYLAPLVAARLAREGLDVHLASVRPGERITPGRRRILLVDDPPLTGRTLVSLAQRLAEPGNTDVLVPAFRDDDVQPLRDAGISVTVLPRSRWASTRRLASGALDTYLVKEVTWIGRAEAPVSVVGFRPGRENSALAAWPGLRRRSPARAAFTLSTRHGRQPVVASWVPPGIFGDAARATATALSSALTPATVGVAPAMVISEDLSTSVQLPPRGDFWLDDAVGYALDRSVQLPVAMSLRAPAPIPSALKTVATALTSGNPGMVLPRLHRWVMSMGSSVPDGRCEAEKWLIDAEGGLRKTGHLTHAYRRDNELLTPLVDLAAIIVAFGTDLKTVAAAVDQRLSDNESCLPALATATLCYGVARGEQLPRTYNPERAAATAREAHRLQRAMIDAALVLQEALHIPVSSRTPVLRRWRRQPAALLQPMLPFRGRPAPKAPRIDTRNVEEAVTQWAEGRFEPVQADGALLLAPLGPASTWQHATAELGDLAARLPHPHLLAWCGVPLVQLEETC